MTTPAPPEPEPDPCGHNDCTAVAIVHWSRRLTEVELAAIPAEQHNDDMRVLVYACGQHAITLDLAAHVHQANCSGPNSPALPACDCIPEPLPSGSPVPTTLPTGWQIHP